MVKKRGNEYSQLSKEEYEAQSELQAHGSGGDYFEEGFTRASAEVLSKRRMLRSKRPTGASTSETSSSGSGSSSIFGGINLTGAGATSSTTPSASSLSLAKPPKFAIPTPSKPLTSSHAWKSSGEPATGNGKEAVNSDLNKLYVAYKKFTAQADVHQDPLLPVMRFVATAQRLLGEKENERNLSKTVSPKQMSATPSTTMASTTTNSSTTSAVSAASSTTASSSLPSAAPASASFSFGTTTTSKPPSSAQTATPTFSFGGSTSSAPAPAPFSGFSFVPAPAAAAPAPGANIKVSLSPLPTPTTTTKPSGGDGDSNDGGGGEEEPTTPMESADVKDWDEMWTTKVKAYRSLHGGRFNLFATGGVKLQQNKSTGKRRMVMRDQSGKVLLNVGISQGMSFNKSKQGKPPKEMGKIVFVGLMDEQRGMEQFALVCKPENLDGLHGKLEELAK